MGGAKSAMMLVLISGSAECEKVFTTGRELCEEVVEGQEEAIARARV